MDRGLWGQAHLGIEKKHDRLLALVVAERKTFAILSLQYPAPKNAPAPVYLFEVTGSQIALRASDNKTADELHDRQGCQGGYTQAGSGT